MFAFFFLLQLLGPTATIGLTSVGISAKQVTAEQALDITVVHALIEHSRTQDLVVDVGVGSPDKPEWSVNLWNRQTAGAENLNITMDVLGVAQYLPPSQINRWFLRVYSAVDANVGQISVFTLEHGSETYASTCVPVRVYGLQTSFSYIPGVPLELAISRRISIREFPDTENYTLPEVSGDLLLKVLWAGYGTSTWGGTVPNISENRAIVLYVCNHTAAYRYDAVRRTLVLWKVGDYRFSPQGWDRHRAPIELFIVIDTDKSSDIYWSAIEGGCVVQNIYLEANSLGLGTVCVGGVDKQAVHDDLSLPANEYVLCNMPLGFPESMAYYNFSAEDLQYPLGSNELPQVKQSSVFLDDTLLQSNTNHNWRAVSLTPQEISQILWSAYGFSYLKDMRPTFWSFNSQHRTVASASGLYPLTIWMVNSTGIYTYDPWTHRMLVEIDGDKRVEIADAVGKNWVASAPDTLVVVWNSSRDDEQEWSYIEAGLVVQNVNLESVAWGLSLDWSKIGDEAAMRSILGLAQQPELHPVIIVSVGHSFLPTDLNSDGVVNIVDLSMVAKAFGSSFGQPRWNQAADLNKDGVIDIRDISLVARDFGKRT